MKRIRLKPLGKTQQAIAWRVALRYLGHALNGNDGFTAASEMVPIKVQTLNIGLRLGRRIFARCEVHSTAWGRQWSERGIGLVHNGWPHAGKIANANPGFAGWTVGLVGASGANTFAVYYSPLDGEWQCLQEGLTSKANAIHWALKPTGQAAVRRAFLTIKP